MPIERSADRKSVRFCNSYSRGMFDPKEIIADMRDQMQGVKYDTLVGRGTSGMLVIPIVAKALRKNWFIVRKEHDYTNAHGGVQFMGDLGRRWVFLDDFVSSGETFSIVRQRVRDAVEQINAIPDERYDMAKRTWVKTEHPPFSTELVGLFEYESRGEGWSPWGQHLRNRDWSDRYTRDIPTAYEQAKVVTTTITNQPTKTDQEIQALRELLSPVGSN
jgi:hypothetical protein